MLAAAAETLAELVFTGALMRAAREEDTPEVCWVVEVELTAAVAAAAAVDAVPLYGDLPTRLSPFFPPFFLPVVRALGIPGRTGGGPEAALWLEEPEVFCGEVDMDARTLAVLTFRLATL